MDSDSIHDLDSDPDPIHDLDMDSDPIHDSDLDPDRADCKVKVIMSFLLFIYVYPKRYTTHNVADPHLMDPDPIQHLDSDPVQCSMIHRV